MGELVRWKGMLADIGMPIRRLIAGVLSVLTLQLCITGWGYLGVQFVDGQISYVVMLLVPVGLGALLLGTLGGVGIGFFAGVVLLLGKAAMLDDMFQAIYVNPVSTLLALPLSGLAFSLLFAAVLLSGARGYRHALLMAASCAAGAVLFGSLCAVSSGALQPIETSFMVLTSSVALTAAVLVTQTLAERGMRGREAAGMRDVFGALLLTMVSVAFMVVSAAAYVAISRSSVLASEFRLYDESHYLLYLAQQEESKLNGAPVTDLSDMLHAYSVETEGVVAITYRDVVVASDCDWIHRGERLEDALGDALAAEVEAAKNSDIERRVVFVAPSSVNGVFALAVPGTQAYERLGKTMSRQIGFLGCASAGDLSVVYIMPTSLVFEGRDLVVGWIALATFAILVVVYWLVNLLLDRLVGQPVDATNTALAQITDGNLDVRVVSAGTREFTELSTGINKTVDALKGWISDAEGRMDAELKAARAIQESVLPRAFPPYPDIKRFDIYASMDAANEVGGDFYDFFLVGDDCGPQSGKLAFLIADVSGKGVPAALFMMRSKAMLHDYLSSGMELAEAVENANRILCDGNEEDMFVTTWVGLLDYGTHTIEFVNAGHNPPLMLRGGSWRRLEESSGLPLGLFDGLPYKKYTMPCEVGDMLLIYTDGVTEAFSADEEQYGEGRLLNLLEEFYDLHPRELIDRISYSLGKHAEGAVQSDDITMLALEVGVPPEEKAALTVPANIAELDAVYQFIHAESDRRLCPVRVQNQLDIAVEELFVNVCRYAYEQAGDDVDRYVRITYAYSADPTSLTVEIIDNGVAFNPLEASSASATLDLDADADMPLSLGIFMVRKNADDMSYERLGDSNVVTLVKYW